MQIAVFTVQRPEPYLNRMLDSLFAQDATAVESCPVHLFVGSPEDDYVSHLENDERFRIVRTPEVEWNEIKDWPSWKKASWNAQRALRSDSCDLLLLEDDIVFGTKWHARLGQAVASLRELGKERYLLTGYVVYHKLWPATRHCGRYPAGFYASCCVHLPTAARLYATREVAQRPGMAFDIALGNAFNVHNTYGTLQSLVQHVGDTSTIGNPAQRRAFRFSGAS